MIYTTKFMIYAIPKTLSMTRTAKSGQTCEGIFRGAALLAKLSRLPNLWVICRLPETKWQIAILR